MHPYPFRLGTTSYIIPDDLLPNARYLAGKVRDMELILFEVDDGPSNLPAPEVIEELSRLASQHDLTYTVHLPLDLKLGEDGSEDEVIDVGQPVVSLLHEGVGGCEHAAFIAQTLPIRKDLLIAGRRGRAT